MKTIFSQKLKLIAEIFSLVLLVSVFTWLFYPTACTTDDVKPNLLIKNHDQIIQNIDWNKLNKIEKEEIDMTTMAPPSSSIRECKGDGKASKNTTVDTLDLGTFYVVSHRNRNGYWQNPSDGFAVTYYDAVTNEPFLFKSYQNQMSTDVVSQKVRYPASMRLRSDGTILVVHKQNRYETDITYKEKGKNYTIPAVIKIDAATGDTICTGSYDCGKFISGCNWY